jgi:hypothetical protein
MILRTGEKILIIHRQFFERDGKRHFVGQVEQCEGPMIRVTGYLFAVDSKTNEFAKRPSLRTRIMAWDEASL